MLAIEHMMVFIWGLYCIFFFWCLRGLLEFAVDYWRDVKTDRHIQAREEEWRELQKKLKS
tara:strand:- start:355 stop:534 length:180 start_codon:yes stop_codon:yes gene_type:complete